VDTSCRGCVPGSGRRALDGRVERLHVAGAVGGAAVGAAAGVERRVARVLDRGVLVHCARPGSAGSGARRLQGFFAEGYLPGAVRASDKPDSGRRLQTRPAARFKSCNGCATVSACSTKDKAPHSGRSQQPPPPPRFSWQSSRRSCGFAHSQQTCTDHPCKQCATCSQQGVAPLNGSMVLGRTVVKRVRVVVQARQTLGVAGIANLREPQEHLAQVGVVCIQKSACLLRTQLQGRRRDASMTASAHRLSRERCAHHDVHHAARVGHVVVHLRGSGFSKGFS